MFFDGRRACGVNYIKRGKKYTAHTDREVVLCGGAINSPQLLMLSGIGQADDLRGLDISVVQDLPGVGQNLQDHLGIYVQYKSIQPVTLAPFLRWHNLPAVQLEWMLKKTGPGARTHIDAGAFIRCQPDAPHPDTQLHFVPVVISDHGRNVVRKHAFQALADTMRPTSSGYLKLRSANPTEHPIIQPNYLATEQDRLEMRDLVKLGARGFLTKGL